MPSVQYQLHPDPAQMGDEKNPIFTTAISTGSLKLINAAISRRDQGGDLTLVLREFRGLSEDQLNQEYGVSGRTRRQVLEGYQKSVAECQSARDLIRGLSSRSKPDIGPEEIKILKLVSSWLTTEIANANDDLGRCELQYSGVKMDSLVFINPDKTCQEVLDGYGGVVDRWVNAQAELNRLIPTF